MAAPKALEQVKIAGKIITGDAIHAQRAFSAQIIERGGDDLWVLKENQERLFAPETPKPGFGKSRVDFLHDADLLGLRQVCQLERCYRRIRREFDNPAWARR